MESLFFGPFADIPTTYNYTATVQYATGYYRAYYYSRNGGNYLWLHIVGTNLTSDTVNVSAGELIYSVTGAESLSQTRTVIIELD